MTRDVEALVVRGWRAMSAAEKVQQVRQLTTTARRFALAGMRDRHPGETEEELRLRLASFWLDDATMARIRAVGCNG